MSLTLLYNLKVFDSISFLLGTKCTSPYVSIDSKCYYFSSEKASWDKAYVSIHYNFFYIGWYY